VTGDLLERAADDLPVRRAGLRDAPRTAPPVAVSERGPSDAPEQ
jgi:hypothetical protein